MTNHEIPHLVKIGHTTRELKERERELKATGTPGRWRTFKSWYVPDSQKHEKYIHKELSQFRQGGRELYRLDAIEAALEVSMILRSLNVIDEEDLSEAARKKARIKQLNKELKVESEKIYEIGDKINKLKGEIDHSQSVLSDLAKEAVAPFDPNIKVKKLGKGLACGAIGVAVPLFWIPAAYYLVGSVTTDPEEGRKSAQSRMAMLNQSIDEKKHELISLFNEFEKFKASINMLEGELCKLTGANVESVLSKINVTTISIANVVSNNAQLQGDGSCGVKGCQNNAVTTVFTIPMCSSCATTKRKQVKLFKNWELKPEYLSQNAKRSSLTKAAPRATVQTIGKYCSKCNKIYQSEKCPTCNSD